MRLDEINNALLVWGRISHRSLKELKEHPGPIIVAECRPSMTGLLHNASLLKDKGIPFVYINDNTLGLLFYKRKITKTVIFYVKRSDNDFVGISGTLYATLLSKLHNVEIQFKESHAPAAPEEKEPRAFKFTFEEPSSHYIIKETEELIDNV